MMTDKKFRALGEKLFFPVLLVLVWSLAAQYKWVNPYLLPSPLKVGKEGWELILSGELAAHLGVSLIRVLTGFCITLLTAVPLSFLIHLVPPVKRLLKGPLEFLRAVPPLAAIPLLILWFGIGESSKTAVIVMASFFPVFLNLLGGLNHIDPAWEELSRSLNLKKMDYIRFILFPAALPAFLTGIQLGISYCWRALMGAEMIAAASGLGYLILDAQEMGRIDRVYVGILALGFCGIVLDTLLIKAFNRMIPWRDLEADRKW